MSDRTVSQSITHRSLVSLSPKSTVLEAARTMTKANTGSVLIMDPNGELLGILTERDLMTRVLSKALNPELTLVTEVMTAKPHCITSETTVSNAVLIMIERGFRHLPITSSAGKVLGVFSVRDALPKEIGEAVSLAEFLDQAGNTLA